MCQIMLQKIRENFKSCNFADSNRFQTFIDTEFYNVLMGISK